MDRSKSLAACLVLSLLLAAFVFGLSAVPAAAQSRWGTAMPIEFDNAGDAFGPRVAVDGSGRVFAAWAQSDGVRSNAWASRFVPGSGWEAPTTIEFDLFGAGAPDVAADSNGNALAVWEQYDGTRTNIWANRYLPGVGWAFAERIESDDAGFAYRSQVAMDGSGNAFAAWEYHDGVRWRAVVNRFALATGGWGTPVPVDPGTGGGVLDHALAVAPNGDAVVVVSQCCGPADIWANVYSGGVWLGPALIETDNAGDAISPSVAMDASGNAVAVWRQWDGSYRSVMANRFVSGVGWGLARAVETNPGDVGGTPQVALDGAGDAVAVWEQSDGIRSDIWANRLAGAAWGTPVRLESESTDAASPDVAVHPAGDALAVWSQSDGLRANIWASRFRPASGWQAAERIETDNAGGAMQPVVAMDAAGNGMAAWSHYDGTRFNIWANRFTVDAVAPMLDVRSPVDGTLTRVRSVTVEGATEPGATVTINGSAVPVFVDGTFSQIYAGLADGTHAWVVVSTDAEGNANAETRTVTVDTTPPTLVFSAPVDGQTLNRPTFLVAGQTEEGARLVVFGLVIDLVAGGSFSFWMTLPEGQSNVWSTATDPAGNVLTVGWSVTIDTTAPFLALTSPTPGLTNNPSVRVSGDTDPGTTVLVNGTSVPVDPTGRFSLTATLPDGDHFFDVNAFDAAMNFAYQSVMITVDTAAPALALTAPSDGATTTTPVVTVSGTTEPDVRLVVNGVVASVAPDGSFAFELALREGANTILATATDPAGNAATASVTVTYTNPVPGLQQQLQALQAQLATMDQRIQDLEADLAAANQALQDLQADLDAMGQTLAVLRADLDAATAALNALQADLDTANQALQDARDSLAAANARLDSLQTNLLVGLVAVVVILGALQFGLARMAGRKGGGEREPSKRDEESEEE